MPFNEDIKLHGYRIYRFKPMSEEHFVKTDTGTPEVDDTSMPGVSSDGFTTFGLRYGRLYGATAEAWYYDLTVAHAWPTPVRKFPSSRSKWASGHPILARSICMNGTRMINYFLTRILIPISIPRV
jgi:hypothetical protein